MHGFSPTTAGWCAHGSTSWLPYRAPLCFTLRMTLWGPHLPPERRKLRKLRQAVPLSMSELAERAGCSYQHLRRLETTGFRPSPELATRIAQILSEALGRDVSRYEFSDDAPPRSRRPS